MMLKMQSVVVCTFQSVIVKKKSPFHQMRTLTLKAIPIRPRFAEHLSLRTLSSSSSLDYSDQSRGGLPRFFSKLLPPSKALLSLSLSLSLYIYIYSKLDYLPKNLFTMCAAFVFLLWNSFYVVKCSYYGYNFVIINGKCTGWRLKVKVI